MAEYSPEQYLASLLTTPEQEARNLRASRSRQRILALGDALRHIGNIYNTTQGAPAQQFNDPVTAERTRYQQDKLLRDANNMKYFSYQQAKQAQDAKQRQWEREFSANEAYRTQQLTNRKQELDRLDKQYELNERKAAWQQMYQQGLLDIKKEQQKLDQEYKSGMLSVAQYRAATYALNASGGGGGRGNGFETTIEYEPNEYDAYGKMTRRGTQHTRRVPINTQPPAGGGTNLNLVGGGNNLNLQK